MDKSFIQVKYITVVYFDGEDQLRLLQPWLPYICMNYVNMFWWLSLEERDHKLNISVSQTLPV